MPRNLIYRLICIHSTHTPAQTHPSVTLVLLQLNEAYMTKQGVSPLKFLTRLTPSPKKAKETTITFQNYEQEDMRQKYCLKIYMCKSVIELIPPPRL